MADTLNGEYSRVRNRYGRNDDLYVRIYSLEPGTEKFFKGKACTFLACSDFSEIVIGRTADFEESPSNVPTDILLSTDGTHIVSIDFTAVAFATYYEVERFSASGQRQKRFTTYTNKYSDETITSNAIYQYAIRACNLNGCTDYSQLVQTSVDTFPEPEIAFTLRSATTTSNDHVYLSYGFDFSDRANIEVDKVKLFASNSIDDEKSLIHTDELTDGSIWNQGFYFEDAIPGQLYYFWLENCIASECVLSDTYITGRRLAAINPTLRKPVIRATSGELLDAVTLFGPRTLYDTELEIYIADTLDGEKQRVENSLDPDGEMIRVSSGEYAPRFYYFWGRVCFYEICSEYSEPIRAHAAPQHVNQRSVLRDREIWKNGRQVTDGLSGWTSAENYIYLEHGMDVDFNLFIDQEMLASCDWNLVFEHEDVSSNDLSNWNDELLRFRVGGNNCPNAERFPDSSKLYLYFDDDEQTSIEIDASTYQLGWNTVKFDLSPEKELSVLFNGEAVITKNIENRLSITPLFAKFSLISRQVTRTYDERMNQIKMQSKVEMDTDRPVPVDRVRMFNAYGTPELSISVYRQSDSAITQTALFSVDKDGWLTRVATYEAVLSSTTTYQYVSDSNINEQFIVASRHCIDGKCSRYEFDTDEIDHLPEVKQFGFSSNVSGDSATVYLTWSLRNTTYLKIFIGTTADSLSFIEDYRINGYYRIDDATENGFFAQIQPCNEENGCGPLSEVIAVSVFGDFDGDGLTDDEEQQLGTDMFLTDTDGDGLSDSEEVELGSNPLLEDTDGDGVNDAFDSNPNDANLGMDHQLDINDNDQQDLLVVGAKNGTQRIVLVDVLDSSITQEVVLPTWFNPQRTTEIRDTNGDGEWDILTLGSTPTDAQIWLLHDGETGSLLHSNTYPGWLQPAAQKDVLVLKDVNTNGRDDILLLIEKRDGRDALALYDGQSRSLLKALLMPGWFEASKLIPMTDWTGNGVQEVVVFGQTTAGNPLWLKYDPVTGANLGQGRYPGWFTADQVILGPDFNDNGTESIITLGSTSAGARLWLAQDGRSGRTTKSLGYPGWLQPFELITVDDPNGDGKADIATLAKTSKGNWLWRRTSSQNNAIQRQYSYPGWFTPNTIQAIGDLNSNGEPELITNGENPSGSILWLKTDGMLGTNLGRINSPNNLILN